MGENLTIAWWNTSMSPASSRDRMDEEQKQIALSIIVKLIDKYKLDILCLGEVSPNDIGLLEKILDSQPYAIYNCTHSNGKIKHDLCVIYNKQKMCYIESKEITEVIPHIGSIKAGHKLHFYHSNSEQKFFIYVSHWPSHMYFGDICKRYELGKTLRESIEDCKKEQDGKFFIILGDFNDEPFSPSLVEGLGSTRDRKLVVDKELLYNPFWRHLGSKIPYPSTKHQSFPYGTYYYRSDAISKWKTFDQIIFSAAFLRKEKWNLKEKTVKIIHGLGLYELILDRKYHFDHLPVMASIERIM